jgi:hypothetical protein
METPRIVILTIVLLGSVACYGQTTDNVGVKKDSLQVAMEREQLSTSLLQLRDSIVQSVQTLEERKTGAVAKSKRPIDKALKELRIHHGRVQKDLDELVSVSKRGWDTDVAVRLRASLNNVRREHNRIRQDLEGLLSAKS